MSDDDENEKQSLIESVGNWISTSFSSIKKTFSATRKMPPIAAYIAKGEVAAMKIKAEGMVAIMEEYTGHDVSWKKGNLESISRKSEEYMSQDGREEKAKNLSREWASTFADKCGNISDEDMQERWAKILAGEVDNPGAFSKKTLSVLSDMSKKDAKLFTDFCQFVWLELNKNPIAIIHDIENSVYEQGGINFPTLQHLESIGLISRDIISVSYFSRDYKTPQPIMWYYHNTAVMLYPKDKSQKNIYSIPTGQALLTQSGKELFPITDASRNDKFFEYMIDKWQKEGYVSIIPDPAASKEND